MVHATRSTLSKSPSSKRQSVAKMYLVEDADEILQSDHNLDLRNALPVHLTEASISGSKLQRSSHLSQPKSVKGKTIETAA